MSRTLERMAGTPLAQTLQIRNHQLSTKLVISDGDGDGSVRLLLVRALGRQTLCTVNH